MFLALAMSGCGGVVVEGVDGGGGNVTASASNALVVRGPDPGGMCAIEAAMDPPGAVFLLVASQPIACAHPELLPDLECPARGAEVPALWEACIPLQPALAPTRIDFSLYGPAVELVAAAAGCEGPSAGIMQQGALAITAVSPSSMTLTLSGTAQQRLKGSIGDGFYEVDADGSYEALRCP
jgi:hypothetical protein